MRRSPKKYVMEGLAKKLKTIGGWQEARSSSCAKS
jgi:hypothetical protein